MASEQNQTMQKPPAPSLPQFTDISGSAAMSGEQRFNNFMAELESKGPQDNNTGGAAMGVMNASSLPSNLASGPGPSLPSNLPQGGASLPSNLSSLPEVTGGSSTAATGKAIYANGMGKPPNPGAAPIGSTAASS